MVCSFTWRTSKATDFQKGTTKMMVTIGLLALLLTSGLPGLAAGEDCSETQYLDGDGNCQSCKKTCPAGQKAKQDCGSGKDLICEPCTDLPSGKTCAKGNERDCFSCKRHHKKTARECNAHLDSVCYGCLDGYFPKARIQGEVDCIRCDAEKNNRSECRVPENPVIKCAPPDPKQYKAKLEDDQHYKESQRWTVIAAVALTAAAALTVIVAIFFLKRNLCKQPYRRAPGRDPEAPATPERRHPAVADRREESSTLTEDSEDDQCRVDTNNKKVKFTKARASSNQSEDGQKLLQSNNVPDSKRPKLKLKMPKRSSVGELEVRVSGSRTSSPVKAVPSPKKGTPSPFPVSDAEENVFSYTTGNQPVNVQPELHVIEDAQEPFAGPTTSQASTPTGSLDLSGQTARLHKDSRPNHTANDYASNLAWCKERASSILLDNDWFSYNIQQNLAVYLDRIPPASSMPTWRTFFERFGLTKHDLNGVNTASVQSPTLALFAVLQTRNAKDRHTVKKILETLHDLKLYDAANYLCEELLKYKQKPKS